MSPDAHACLVELDAVSREAREFYEYAAAVLPASALRERCLRLGQAKAELVALLALRLRGGRDGRERPPIAPTAAAGLCERIGQAFARARVGLATPDPGRLWDELERIEAAVAEECRRHASGSGDADSRRELGWVMPVLQRCRDELGADAPTAMASSPPVQG